MKTRVYFFFIIFSIYLFPTYLLSHLDTLLVAHLPLVLILTLGGGAKTSSSRLLKQLNLFTGEFQKWEEFIYIGIKGV